MSFVGRSFLLGLVDQMVAVRGGPQIDADTTRPVLLLEGCGGAGRSSLLREVSTRWSHRTPTARVDPLALPEADGNAPRPLIAAIMLGLSAAVPGFKVSFKRVVLAHIAMSEPVRDADPERAVEVMRERLNTYRDNGALGELVGSLAQVAQGAVQNAPMPGADIVGAAVVEAAEQEVVRRLHRAPWLTRVAWSDALAWFGHQDQQLQHDPVRALVQLSRQAQSTHPAVGEDVDDLLAAALVADLRESLVRVANRPSNALLMIDNGDTPEVIAFIGALIKVRENAAEDADPLTVVVTSGGSLAAALRGAALPQPSLREAQLGDLRLRTPHAGRTWLPVALGELSVTDVRHLAKEHLWPADLGSSVVAGMVHRLTAGHPAATALVLEGLQAAPELIDDCDAILRRASPTPDLSIEDCLLDRIVAGLSPRRRVDPQLREGLVTLAAARSRGEAEQLRALLDPRVAADPTLFTSTVLWPSGAPGDPALAPFVRYLLLRALAARPPEHPASWCRTFTALLAATEADDLAGRLHHRLALGEVDAVVARLAVLLPEMPGHDWLALLDRVTATADLRPRPPTPEPEQEQEQEPEPAWQPAVRRLVEHLHEVGDPQRSDRGTLRHGYLLIALDYEELHQPSRGGGQVFIDRGQEYRDRARSLS